jgi:hypothetical protein
MSTKRKRTWERRAEESRKKHRPKLRDWTRDKFATDRKVEFATLKTKYSSDSCIDRMHCSEITVQEFIDKYERKSKPCMISDIPKNEKWKAYTAWDWNKFHHLRRRYFKVGEDDDGYSIKVWLFISRFLLPYRFIDASETLSEVSAQHPGRLTVVHLRQQVRDGLRGQESLGGLLRAFLLPGGLVFVGGGETAASLQMVSHGAGTQW